MSMEELLWNLVEDFARENKKFPSVFILSEKTGVKPDVIVRFYRKWKEDGKTTMIGNHYGFADKDYIAKLQKQKQIKIPSEEKRSRSKRFLFLKLVAAMAASILTMVSIHFTYEFNKIVMPNLWAFLLSFSVVIFMSCAFAIKSFAKDNFQKQVIVILWFIGISYSVFTAVSGQFNEIRKYEAADKTEIVTNQKDILNSMISEKRKAKDNLEHWRKAEELYTNDPQLKVENPGTWRSIRNGITELKSVEKDLNELELKLLDCSSENLDENKSVYAWLSDVLGIKIYVIQFFMILFPSLFIDLCSTVLVGFVLGKNNSEH